MIRCILLIVLVFTYFGTLAQLHLGLEDAREMLRHNSLSIHQSELRQKAARIDLEQAYDALIPNLTFNVSNQYTMGLNFDQVTGQLITGNQWTNSANATVSSGIVVFQGLKGMYNIHAGRLNVDIAQLDTEKLRYELDLQLLSLFFQTLINADLHRASLEQAKLSGQQLMLEEVRIEVGKGTLLDIAQAKNKQAADQFNVSNTRSAYDLSLLRLKQLLELPADSAVELVLPAEANRPLIVDQYPDLNFVRDVYVRQVDKKIEYSSIQTRIARASYYPTISVNTGYGTNYSSRRSVSAFSSRTMPFLEQMNQNRSLYIGLGLSYTIFDRFNTKANVRKSQINTESLQIEKDKVMRERRQAYEQAKMEYEAAIEEQKALKVAFDATQTAYEAMKERYEVGKSSSIDLYKALTDYNMAEFRRITNKYNIMLKGEIVKLQTAPSNNVRNY